MSDLLSAIKQHLGIRIREGQLNHYSLFGLDKNASSNDIKQAVRTAVTAWNGSDTKSDPESAQQVAKLIKQAQAILLDESKKQEYDQQLSGQGSTAHEALFPQADPYASFDPSACLIGAGISPTVHSFGSVNDRWNQLRRQIPTLSLPSMAPVVSEDRLDSVKTVSQKTAHTEQTESAASRIERLKRKRKWKQALSVAGFVVVAIAFLGYAGIRFLWNRQELAKRLETDVENATPIKTLAKPKESIPKSIGGKIAIKATGNDPAFVLPTLSKEDSSVDSAVAFTENDPFGNASKAANSTEPMKPDSTPTEPMQSPPTPPPTEAVKPAPLKPNEDKPMVPATTGTSKADWVAAMLKAKEAVTKTDFATFHKQIELALPLSNNDDMMSKHARLDQLGQLYEIFIKSVHEAKSKMRGADTLSVGKLLVNIVEIKDDELIVRMQGKNERYAWDRLPPGIAIALADLTLSDQEPTDIAARAVYFSLSPVRNDLFAKKVKDWFEKSVGKGSIRKDLVQALTDTYE